jgi:hypothetical protein
VTIDLNDPSTKAVVQDIAEEASYRAVSRTLTTLGIDTENPLAAQRDFAALRDFRETVMDKEWQKDQLHLRRWRVTMDKMTSRGMVTTMVAFITASVTSLWAYFSGRLGF